VANLTLTIDADILRAARIRALEQGTSVNALVREYLRAYVEPRDARGILERSFDRADRSGASSGSGGRRWKREDLYDRWERSRRS
jgi:plasmid stability protein